ncbi:Hypp5687 [Branchiostoma lanceolatum]|uniref:Hypp5687 protein n=1 Tax=Branchiostoma lanceolatum TaxID=7740 RepID=A0A8J9W3K4_BRALA|nr:Hypp5687 [Branchiostoma lanceolatum]CAH1239012.1 Hypp5687 [Branchiostoma lanceolatum]
MSRSMALVNRLTSITRPLMMICRQFSDVSADLKSVVSSLTSKRKHVPHWYLYDTRGSEIYEEIVRRSSTYQLWNHEYALLQTHVKDIVGKMSSPAMLVELGSGASSKTRPVIEALLERQTALTYVPVDIAKVQDRLVLGLDMNTDREAVVRAYVAENTRCPWLDNFIERLNKDFEADMDKMAFEDTVDFVENPADGDKPSYIQQYLRSSTAQRLHLKKPGLAIDFQAGERLYLSEGPNYSCKYSEHQVRRLAEKCNFAVEGFWADEEAKYCVVCLVPNEE